MNKIFDKNIKTERLLLRKLTIQDSNDMFEFTSNENCITYLSWEAHKEKDQALKFIKNTLLEYESRKTRFTWGIELISENKLIGVISIFDISYTNKRVEVSYILNPDYQSKGYMKETLNLLIHFIFNQTDFRRIQARCSEDNISSEKLMKSVSMQFEGKLREFWNIKGLFKDVLIYSIIKKYE